jgi:hypothetical protein
MTYLHSELSKFVLFLPPTFADDCFGARVGILVMHYENFALMAYRNKKLLAQFLQD